jgi:hypothetical protein
MWVVKVREQVINERGRSINGLSTRISHPSLISQFHVFELVLLVVRNAEVVD